MGFARRSAARFLAVAGLLAAGISSALSQPVIHQVQAGKGKAYHQTAPGTTNHTGFQFNAWVFGGGLGSIAAPVLTGPTNVPTPLTFDGAAWYMADFVPTQALLDARYPNGAYTVTANGRSYALSLGGDAYPNAPILTMSGGAWVDGKYMVDPTRPISVATNTFTGFGSHADGWIQVFIGWDGTNVFDYWVLHSSSPTADTANLTIPAGTMETGREYYVGVGFYSIVDSDGTPGSRAYYGAFSALNLKAEPPPPVFPMTVTANIGPVTSNASALIQPRPQDVGTTASVYVFALAPANLVQNAQTPGIAETKSVGGQAKADEPAVQCVLAQLSSTGQLVGVSAGSLQAYVTGVLGGQQQAVTILNGVPTVNIGGAIFYVGYGASALDMVSRGINQRAVAVPSANVCDPKPPQTGWWWNPAEDGRGYSIEVHGRNLFFASFLYDVTGRSSWYVATGPWSLDGSYFDNRLLGARGGQTLWGAYSAFPALKDEGAITLAFNNSLTGTLVWPGGAVPIQRFNIVPNGLTMPPVPNQPESGWWWNANEAGRGFFLEWQGGILNIAGYMYDDQGNPVWYLTQNATPTTNAQTFSGNWWIFGGGMTLMGPWRPHARINDNVAPVTIQFQGSENAIMTLPDGRTTAITRHRF